MKRFKKFGTALLSCMMLTASFATVSNMTMITAEAHPGRTDAQGGHHDYKNKSGLGSYLKMSTLNSTFFHVFIVLPFCTIRSLFHCIFSLLGSAIVRLPLLPASHAPYSRSYASCFTSSSNSSPAE